MAPRAAARRPAAAMLALVAAAALLACASLPRGADAAPLIVALRNLKTEAGPAYAWDVRSTLLTGENYTVYHNDSELATFKLDVSRRVAGNGYAVSGSVDVANPSINGEPLEVVNVRLLLGPGLPLLGPTPKVLDCPLKELQPGEGMACRFRVQLGSSSATTVTPAATARGASPVTGLSRPLSFPAPDAGFSGRAAGAAVAGADGSSGDVIGGDPCMTLADSIAAGGAEIAIRPPSGGDEQGVLSGGGVRVCDADATFKYSVMIGPFDRANGVCGSYALRNAPKVTLSGFGSVNVAPAAGTLLVSGCRQRDMLGLLRPTVALSKVTIVQRSNFTWAIESAGAVSADGSLPPRDGADASFDSKLLVNSSVALVRTGVPVSSTLVGEVTLTNDQVVPYLVGGVRVALTGKGLGEAAGGAEPDVVYIDASCPVVNTSSIPLAQPGSIIVPPQLLANRPGVLKCTFGLQLDPATFQPQAIQAQMRTGLNARYEVDSGPPTAFDAAAVVEPDEVGGCVNVFGQRLRQLDDLTPAFVENSPALTVALGDIVQRGVRLASGPTGLADGLAPPAPEAVAAGTAKPLTVCSNTTLTWTETFGPFPQTDCGRMLSVLALAVQPTSGDHQGSLMAALDYPINVRGCNLVPGVQLSEAQTSAKKGYAWSVEEVVSPPAGVSVSYTDSALVEYAVHFKRSGVVGSYQLQAVAALSNPFATELGVTRVSYSVSRPDGEAPVTGDALCRATIGDAALAAAQAAQGPAAALQQKADKQQEQQQQQPPSVAAAAAPGQNASAAAAADQAVKPPARILYKLLPAPSAAEALQAQQAGAPAPEGVTAAVATSSGGRPLSRLGAAAAGALASSPGEPLYCAFVVPVPDDYSAKVHVTVDTWLGEQATSPLTTVSWAGAKVFEEGRCALASLAFEAASPLGEDGGPAAVVAPAALEGQAPPAPAKPAELCEPAVFSFKARVGPFRNDQCGVSQLVSRASAVMPDAAPGGTAVRANATTPVSITGCPPPLPVLALVPGSAKPSQVAYTHDWLIERTMLPLGTTAAPATSLAGAAGARLAATAAVATTVARGGVALFNQTLVFRRGPMTPHAGLYQVRGELALSNPGDKPARLANVAVRLTQAGGGADVTVPVECPREATVPASAPATGMLVVVPPRGADGATTVTCSYKALLQTSSLERVRASASATVAADGRRAASRAKNEAELSLSDAKAVTLGQCAKVAEAQAVGDASGGGAPAPPLAFVGGRVAQAGETLCGTKAFTLIGQVGPVGGAAPAYRYTSSATLEPTSGFQGKVSSPGQLDVRVV